MKNKNYRVSRATLYNTIELLLDSNLVVKHQFGRILHSLKEPISAVSTIILLILNPERLLNSVIRGSMK